MINRTLKQVEQMSKGEGLASKFEQLNIKGVANDTRKELTGCLYVPIVGENFNGHVFTEKAVKERGAVASFWQKDQSSPPKDVPLILVDDTIEALQNLSSSYRDQLNVKVVGVTGSNGKTTTKDIVTTILQTKYTVHKTAGNYNNHIGLPLTILSMSEDVEVAVLEMGMSGRGEIELLSNISKPDAAIITNIGESHLQDLGSREGIAEAKLEIASGLKEDGVLIINGDEPLLTNNKVCQSENVIRFGISVDNDLVAEAINMKPDGTKFSVGGKEFFIPILGKHNVTNALAAMAVAEHLGLTDEHVRKGLKEVSITGMRNEVIHTNSGWTIINDAYNASPTSMKAAIDLLTELTGYNQKIVVLGDMLELGDLEKQFHRETGSHINEKEIDFVFTYGLLGEEIAKGARKKMSEDRVRSFRDKDALITALLEKLTNNDIVLVKASRGMKLEEVVIGING
ncbi:UDP-N-acetylmuramoyl-tripeptide--D-alanyl-D-alanine ligase [Bacillus sp. FJAT-45066]|uniref:UDP-N-acetylmuramoyl-tripeptide--D-alanyl-D- alanine ligase n=1 Tax=Bacillus sp. FJAT-45066 TaxID=2011010 RepID=UPI000BB8BE98|nr:UDP-N-acetylmuramoyl-tripeptide--D-alanyl-D-alanine ligase [Bacillus sp. FJAT-45066]